MPSHSVAVALPPKIAADMPPPPKYLTGDKEGIKEFIDKFDVSVQETAPAIYIHMGI